MLEEVEAEPCSRGDDEIVLFFVICGLSLTNESNQLRPRLVEANLQGHPYSMSTGQPAIRRPTREQHWATNQILVILRCQIRLTNRTHSIKARYGCKESLSADVAHFID